MTDLARLPTVLPSLPVERRPRFPSSQLRLQHKRLKVTVVATFEIGSDEVREQIERNVADALSALAHHGRLSAAYEVIR
jgi:hypothetical protein